MDCMKIYYSGCEIRKPHVTFSFAQLKGLSIGEIKSALTHGKKFT